MEAANRGAVDAGAESIGINIQLPMEQRINPYVRKAKGFHYFFTRKVMLSISAQAYVFYPGGFGTMDELLEMMALAQLNIVRGVPIVLVGKEFWRPFTRFLNKQVYQEIQAVNKKDMDLIQLVGTEEEALEILSKTTERPYVDMDMAKFYGEKKVPLFDFEENPNWKIFRIMSEFVAGFQFISELDREVAILGSGRVKRSSRYYKAARELGRQLANEDYTIITPGGPGVMEAANRGAMEVNGVSVGLDRMTAYGHRMNRFLTHSIAFHYYFTRKVILAASSRAYVIFPGGLGTLDDFFDLITLIQTQKMESIPIVLYGKDYWNPLLKFIYQKMEKQWKTISPQDRQLFTLVDDVREAFDLVVMSKERQFF